MITDAKINEIIAPALREIDMFTPTSGSIFGTYSAIMHFMLNDWDSWFHIPDSRYHKNPPIKNYLYRGTVFDQSEINYIVGGYAFNKLGFSYYGMLFWITAFKNNPAYVRYRGIKMPGELTDYYYWGQKGWDLAE